MSNIVLSMQRGPKGTGLDAELPQLTLFPRFSESGEAEFGNIGAGLREHLLEERLLQSRELVVLTLMKGDEAVEASEETADGYLFRHIREIYCALKELARNQLCHQSATFGRAHEEGFPNI